MERTRLDRVFRLINLMIGSSRYTVKELARKAGVNRRTVYRYIQSFRDCGFSVIKSGECYSLARDRGFIRDIVQLVHFTDEEACVFYRMLHSLDANSLMKQTLKRKLEVVYNCTSFTDMIDDLDLGNNINRLCDAISQQRKVILKDYCSVSSHNVRDRVIEPFAFMNGYIGIWGYDVQLHQNRLFKTKRIGSVEELDEPWENGHLHKQGFQDLFHFTGHEKKMIRLRLGMTAHSVILEEYPLSEDFLSQVDESHWMLEAGVASYIGVCRFVVGLMDDIEIVDSPELEEFVCSFLKKNIGRLTDD